MAGGRCGFWIDSTVAAGPLYDAKQSQIAERVGFAPIPTGAYSGLTWLWSWNLAIPASSKQQDAARAFIGRVQGVCQAGGPGERLGGGAAGHQAIDLRCPRLQAGGALRQLRAAGNHERQPRWADAGAAPLHGRAVRRHPEIQGIGTQVGQTIAGTLTGQTNVENALRTAQSATERTMRQAGYPK
jgi:sorbitol/mannitol transport system substrate-binding protein